MKAPLNTTVTIVNSTGVPQAVVNARIVKEDEIAHQAPILDTHMLYITLGDYVPIGPVVTRQAYGLKFDLTSADGIRFNPFSSENYPIWSVELITPRRGPPYARVRIVNPIPV